ncbi:hypothetical protein [Sigmofec virus UA08Rod_4104]|uniref:Uncharacterized protein n=1 Tax=Sigmofec virus UA08Rod_4104 TaxID=2929394 RepID=A0A976N278_9VIRU|nr:hypothetical protein [Sigmofec virus UA08Rod_4104]
MNKNLINLENLLKDSCKYFLVSVQHPTGAIHVFICEDDSCLSQIIADNPDCNVSVRQLDSYSLKD